MDKKVIGENIVNLRKKEHMTQSELAEKLNVSDKTISRWERGECIPSVSLLRELAETFHVDVSEIEGQEDIIIEPIPSIDIKGRKVFLFFFSIIISLIFFIMGTLMLYMKNNYNKFQVYKVISRDQNYKIEGRVIFTPKQDILTISSISFSNENLLNEKIYAYYYGIEINDKIMYEAGTNIDKYVVNKTDRLYLFQDILKDINFDFYDFNKEIREIKKGNPRIIIKYVTEKEEKKELSIYLSLLKEISNDKFTYQKNGEETIMLSVRNRAYDLADERYYQLGNINVDKISNIDNVYLKVGDKVDIYVYSKDIDPEISKIPWLSNVLVFSMQDNDNHSTYEKNDKVKIIYWLEPVEALEKKIKVSTVADIPGYTIEIKVNNSLANDEIRVNKELDKIISRNFITVSEAY